MQLARAAVLAIVLSFAALIPISAPDPAAAKQPTAGASAKRAASACAKRTPRGSASRRRCLTNVRSSASKTRDTTTPAAPKPAPQPEPAPSGDTTAPSLSWVAPAPGATVSGILEEDGCETAASDAGGIDSIVFKLDGMTIYTERSAPYDCAPLDTTKLAAGAHTLTATAYDAAGNSRTASVTVSVANAPAPAPQPEPAPQPAPAPSPDGSLVVAIDGGWGTWGSTETTHRAQLGAAVTRHEWDITEPVSQQDALVLKAAAQIGTRIHALLGGNDLGSATSYREFVVGFVRRYGAGGSFWDLHPELDEQRYAIETIELGNEPYFGAMSATEYADTVRPTLEELKRLGLPVKVVLAQRVYGSDTSWMDTLYARVPNLNSLFYAFAEHPYWYAHDPAQVHSAGPFRRIDKVRQRMNEKGAAEKPIYLTEYGESTALCATECVSEAVQAEHLQKMLDAVITRDEWDVEMISVFQLLDRGTNSTDREHGFGILRQNGTQKPVYSFVRGLMQQYRG